MMPGTVAPPGITSATVPSAPRWQFGYLSPLPVVDALHYDFYQAIPSQAVFVSYPLAVGAFSAGSIDEALARIPTGLDYFRRREIDRIAIGGMPLSAFAGRQRMLDLLGEAERTTGIRVTSDVEDVVARLRAARVARIVVAAKWKPEVMTVVEAYFRAAGFDVLGSIGAEYDARSVTEIVTTRSADLAIELGQTALSCFAAADALVLGGGTWLSLLATERLERDAGKPVFSNTTAMLAEACHQFGLDFGGMRHLRLAQDAGALH